MKKKISKLFSLILLCGVLLASQSYVYASSEKEEGGKHEDPLMEHLMDQTYIEFPGMFVGSNDTIKIHLPQFKPVKVGKIEMDFSITQHYAYFWIGVIVLAIILLSFDRKKLVQTSLLGQMVETLVLFIRDDVLKPAMPHDYEKYLPYALTLFGFIFVQNFLGLLPYLSQSTKNLSVTAALAFLTFLIMVGSGLKKHGPFGYFMTFLPIKKGDMPVYGVILFNIILFPIELVSLITKPFALAIRLFANMIAGHAIILSFLLISWGGEHAGWNWFASAPGVLGSVFIYLLEALVAFLQAYVFTLLTAIFVGASLESSH